MVCYSLCVLLHLEHRDHHACTVVPGRESMKPEREMFSVTLTVYGFPFVIKEPVV